LGKRWLILLIVTVPSVANDIDEDIFVKLLPILKGNMHCLMDEFGLIGVDMNDWSLNGFSYVCTVESSSSLGWGCCETDLIVGNNMNNPIRLIMGKITHL
jgi:hypothetical protein